MKRYIPTQARIQNSGGKGDNNFVNCKKDISVWPNGQSAPPSKLVPNIPVGPNQSDQFYLISNQNIRNWAQWKASNVNTCCFSLRKKPTFTASPLVSARNNVWENKRKNSTLMIRFFWLVVPRGKCASTNQKHYPDLGSDTSSVWNFCARLSDVISRGNHWWRRKISAVFLGRARAGLVLFIKVANSTVTCFTAKCEPKFKQFGKDGQA